MIRLFNRFKIPLLLLAVAMYGYWQLTFMEYIMKWDMIDDTFPKRFHLSECLKHGLLPLWSPYQSLGLPIHADPSSYVWYPISWLISLVHGYDFYALNFEFLLHIFIAGLGMYSLGRRLKISNPVSFFMAVCYMFCGYSVGHSQHAMLIIGEAWTPFVLSAFFEMLETKSRYAAVKTGFFIYMMFTGSYIVFTFIAMYMLLALLIYHLAEAAVLKRRDEIIPLLSNASLMALSAGLLSLVYIICIYRVMPYFTRANALSLDLIMQRPFSFKSFLSFLLPYAAISGTGWNTDITMTNGYFGLLALIFLVFTVFVKRNSRQLLFLLFAIFFLAASTGNELPLRKWLYDYFPLMNVFRMPGILRIYTILGFIVVAGYTLDEVLANFGFYKKKLLLLSIGMTVLMEGIVIYSLPATGTDLFGQIIRNCMDGMYQYNTMVFTDNVYVNGIKQLAVLVAFIALIYFSNSGRVFTSGILCLTVVEMVISTQLNIPATVIYPIKLSASEAGFAALPQGFPFTNTKKMIDISDGKPDIRIPGMWTNLNFFTKETPYDGYTSFYLNQYDTFSHSIFFRTALNNKLIYLSDKILSMDSMDRSDITDNLNLYFSNSDFSRLSKTHYSSSPADTVFITDFTPNKITARAITNGAQMLTLMQNNFPGWEVLVNNKPAEIYTSNYTCISSILPAGDNKIEFVFRPFSVVAGFWISLIALLIATIYLLRPFLPVFKSNIQT